MKTSNKLLKEFKSSHHLMGNHFEITVVGKDAYWAENKIQIAVAEIQRIERLLTTFRSDSQTNLINEMAGIEAVPANKEIRDLIKRSIRISSITDGAFDISYGSLNKKFWNFDKTMTSLPDPESCKESIKLINYKNILVDDTTGTVFLKEKGMRIGFGGIGKGYAAEMAKSKLIQSGVESGIVNASGDLTAWGNRSNGEPWTVGITNPENSKLPFSKLEINNMAMATSGNYEKYVTIGGRKYSHTINPKTGFPVTGIKSVTIFSANAEIADAMATPVTVMGIAAGLNLINQLHQIECIIIDDNNKIFKSNNIHFYE